MKGCEFITLISGAATSPITWPLAARAQQSERKRHIGVLMATAADEPESQARLAAFLQAFQQLGWSDGRNLRIDYRWSAGDAARLRKDAAELVALAAEVVLAGVGATALPRADGDCHAQQLKPPSLWPAGFPIASGPRNFLLRV